MVLMICVLAKRCSYLAVAFCSPIAILPRVDITRSCWKTHSRTAWPCSSRNDYVHKRYEMSAPPDIATDKLCIFYLSFRLYQNTSASAPRKTASPRATVSSRRRHAKTSSSTCFMPTNICALSVRCRTISSRTNNDISYWNTRWPMAPYRFMRLPYVIRALMEGDFYHRRRSSSLVAIQMSQNITQQRICISVSIQYTVI